MVLARAYDPYGSLVESFLQEAGVGVVAHDFACLEVFGKSAGREEVLSGKFAGGVGVFDGEGVGEIDFAESVCEAGLVDAAHGLDLLLKDGDEGIGEDGDAAVFALAVADDDLMVIKVNIF